MKANLISKENNVAKFTILITGEELEAATAAVYKKQKDQFKIDGFRKGNAPRSIIEKRYGVGIFMDDAINDVLKKNYPLAIEELGLDPINDPKFDFSMIEPKKDFTVTIEIELYPEFTVNNYKGVEIEKVEEVASDEDLEKEMARLQRAAGRLVEVDRPAEMGDMVIIDYVGTVDGVEFKGGKAESYPLKLGTNTFIEGFEENLVGIKVGETKAIDVVFPEKYHEKSLAGKNAVFTCVCHEIKAEELPELDDEFAKDTSEFDTLEELKADAKKRIDETAKSNSKIIMKDRALEIVYEANQFEVPEIMVEDEISGMINEFGAQMKTQGLDIEKYFKTTGRDMQAFRDELRQDAFKKVKTRMLATAIADAEGLEATEEEANARILELAAMYNLEESQIRSMMGKNGMDYLIKDIRMQKAVDFIFENAVIK